MGRLRDRLRKLEEAAQEETMSLLCPECGAQFVAYGDVPLEFIVHEWATDSGEGGQHDTPASILRLFAHEHDPGALLAKGSGLPFLGREVSGIDMGAGAGESGGA